ncbi:MAG: hypothetical protein QOD03_918, partial [Verrucomicrobiota bacterium]
IIELSRGIERHDVGQVGPRGNDDS